MEPIYFDLTGLLQEAVCKVFETAFFLALVRCEPPERLGMIGPFAISAIIPPAGKFFGFLAMHCSQEFPQQCIRGILPDEDAPNCGDYLDAVCERINRIAGSMKRCLSPMISRCKISLPVVVVSERHWFAHRGAKGHLPSCMLSSLDDGKDKFQLEMLYYRR